MPSGFGMLVIGASYAFAPDWLAIGSFIDLSAFRQGVWKPDDWSPRCVIVTKPVVSLVSHEDYQDCVVRIVSEDCLTSQRTVSDTQGRYSFSSLKAGTCQVYGSSRRVGEDGLLDLHPQTIRVGESEQFTADIQPIVSGADTGGVTPMMPLLGVVVDVANRPVEGAEVETLSGRYTVRSSPDGSFAFCRVWGNPPQLRITHPQYRDRTIRLNSPKREPKQLHVKVVLKARG